jgi:hypothetical protein
MQRCDQCRHYFGYPPSDRPEEISFSADQIRGGGECRSNPPVVFNDLHPIGRFPVVFHDYWCGQFEPNQQHHPTSQSNPPINIATDPTAQTPT